MPCPERLRTQAFIDGEVSEAEAPAVERHIEACTDCQAFVEDAAELSDAIRTKATRYAAPPELRRRVTAMLEAEASHAPRDLREVRARRSFWRGALSGAGITGIAASLAILAVQPPSPATLLDQVTAAHTRALIDGRVIEVASSDHHTVKPWFAGRIDLSPPVQDFAAQGFKLEGGRLDKVGRKPAAVLVYRHGKHAVSLFVWSDHGSDLPAGGVRRGYHVVSWKSGDLDFAAVSDAAPAELANFVQLVRSEPE